MLADPDALSSLHDDAEDGRGAVSASAPSPAKGKRGKGKKSAAADSAAAASSTAVSAAVNVGAGTTGFFAAPQLKVLFGLTDERCDERSHCFAPCQILSCRVKDTGDCLTAKSEIQVLIYS